MRITIDTNSKTITVLQRIELKKLFEALKVILGEEFEEYSMDINYSYVTWSYPYTYVYKDAIWITPTGIVTEPTYTLTTNNNSTSYNVEIK